MKIVLQDLTKTFPGRSKKEPSNVVAVDHFNFEIPDGKLIGLLGPSGCGKSTTLNLLCGLLSPTDGSILFGDEDVTALPPERRGVGLVFMILFKKTPYTDGLINLMLAWFGAGPVDFIDGPYWAKMFVLCFYTIWVVMPFKILILTGALASVDQSYYNAARVDGTSRFRIFMRITLPMISPMIFYLVITGFIGAFKSYSDAVALFGTNLNAAGMNTIVGYVYDMLYGEGGGYPSYASAAAILLFIIVLTITCINLLISRRKVFYGKANN